MVIYCYSVLVAIAFFISLAAMYVAPSSKCGYTIIEVLIVIDIVAIILLTLFSLR